MTFQEILPHFIAGKKIRRKIFHGENLTFWVRLKGDYVMNCYDGFSHLCADDYQATDWELYKEPEPEKTLGEELFDAADTGEIWIGQPDWQKIQWEANAKDFAKIVLRRYYESLPKIEGKERGEIFFEIDQKVWSTNGAWENLSIACKADYAKLETDILCTFQLAPPEPKDQSAPEPKDQSAVERLFNRGFQNLTINKIKLSCGQYKYEAKVESGFSWYLATSNNSALEALINLNDKI